MTSGKGSARTAARALPAYFPKPKWSAAAAPDITLKLVLIGVTVGMTLLIPSLAYLLKIFKGDGNAFDRLERGSPPPDARPARRR